MEVTVSQDAKKDRKKSSKRRKEEVESKVSGGSFKLISSGYSKNGSPGPSSSNGSGSSARPSPTSASTPRPPSRVIDEDYDGADTLLDLANRGGSANSPTVSSGSRHSDPSSRPLVSHRDSISSNRSHMSPPPQQGPLKRPLSPGPEETESKRTRVDSVKRRGSSPTPGRRTPVQSTRPSPIPFRTQPTSHSPEARHDPYPGSPTVPSVLPPHPRPIAPPTPDTPLPRTEFQSPTFDSNPINP
ncbi:hypothetical protein K435DRAFT_681095, partial [Dendrothele bispora CBS 962.96]